MKLLVTGGAGFIGSHFVRYMIQKYPQYRIYNLDALTYAGNKSNIIDLENDVNHRFIHGNICDSSLIHDLMKEGIEAVIHFAAESHVDRSIQSTRSFIQTNIQGAYTLLETVKQYSIQKFIQISTDEVYGSLGKEDFFTETSPLSPNNPYAASKASADLLILSYYKTYGLPMNITRCSNNYGPFQYPEKLIPLMMIHAMENKSLPLYGDGLYIRDWLHVVDHCAAIDLVLHKGKIGEVYNIGGNNEWTNLELVKEILHLLDKPESLIQFVHDRPGHDRRYATDSAKLQRELGWFPVHPFKEGLAETVEWYRQNQEWWQGIVGANT